MNSHLFNPDTLLLGVNGTGVSGLGGRQKPTQSRRNGNVPRQPLGPKPKSSILMNSGEFAMGSDSRKKPPAVPTEMGRGFAR